MTVEQPTLPGLAEGQRLRDEGMSRVTAHSPDRDVEAVDVHVARLNASGRDWSANDLRAILARLYPEILDAKPQLMGARVRAAAMRKEMVKVGYEPSTLPSTHAHPIAVWRGVGGAS